MSQPPGAIPPGKALKELMRENGIGVEDMAFRCALQKTHIRDIINGDARITPTVADALERGTGIGAGLWLQMARNWHAHRDPREAGS